LPPAELGPLPLRQAAAEGDARAQHAIALRYAQGQGMPQDLTEAARWLERAAGAGLAPCMSADRRDQGPRPRPLVVPGRRREGQRCTISRST
jgi:hypothetical protein